MEIKKLSQSEVSALKDLVQYCTGFSSDSRNLKSGEVFVALKGATTDGHDFIEKLIQDKITHFVVDVQFKEKFKGKNGQFVFVSNTHLAHRELAKMFREKYSRVQLLAVGGSAGKTSTKEFVYTLLKSAEKNVFKTSKSQNGELGIPLTLENLGRGYDLGVVEVGIDAPGEMIRHASLVRPNAAVLTSIGEEHLNLMGNVENVFLEEKILFDETLKHGGQCFAPETDIFLARLKGQKNIYFLESLPKSEFLQDKFYEFLPSRIAKQNAKLAAFAVHALGWLSESEIISHVNKLQLPEGRGGIRKYGLHWVIEDHYNSNPSSLGESLRDAADFSVKHKRPLTLVLGDMLDLGPSTAPMHSKIFEEIRKLPPNTQFVFVGAEMKKHSSSLGSDGRVLDTAEKLDSEIAKRIAEKLFKNQTPGIVLVKGSRGMRLEGILQAWSKFATPTHFEGR